jgi:histidinol-phosphate aminotransferase
MTTPSLTPPLMRDAYRGVGRYVVDQSAIAVDLRDNTNLWGVPPAAASAIATSAASVCRYPRIYASALKDALAAYTGVTPDMIVTGCGSDDVLDSALRAIADPGERMAHLDPTFPTALTFAQMNGLTPVGVPLTGSWDADAAALIATGARVIYLCSPNNPTGTTVSRESLERLATDAPGVVIVDEAYTEYARTSAADLVGPGSRLLILRTLSKAFGLAGLRIGYALGSPDLIAAVEKSRGPYKVNAVAEQAAIAALTTDLAWVRARVAETIANRQQLAGRLAALGLPALPSGANFLFAPTPRAVALERSLWERGVGVRLYTGLRGIGDAIRMTVGPSYLMASLIQALEHATGRAAVAEGSPT